jgi:hypothetical protein
LFNFVGVGQHHPNGIWQSIDMDGLAINGLHMEKHFGMPI